MKTTIDADLPALNGSIKTAFWTTDMIVDGLPGLHAFLCSIEVAAKSSDATELQEEAKLAIELLGGMLVTIGILRAALTDLRLQIPTDEVGDV